jgi:alkanesulfonate monooxygenase SsuD/methylene tetrahydromethanopterin reductase-like flavin-dependent oxidoreductase (luciferase family)
MPVDAVVERAQAAEGAGFEGIAFMDHLVPPLAADHGMWDAMALAGWVLARTDRLQVGHLVLCDAFRHPAVLAREVTTLDHASGGRFELGIGWGSVPAEFATFGVAPLAARDRVARLAESLDIMRALWSGEVVEHRGAHFTLSGARQFPSPTRAIPITIGGVGPRTLELVRAHADWWNVTVTNLHRVAELRPEAGAARVSIQIVVALLADESQRAEVTALAERRFGAMARPGGLLVGTAPELAAEFAARHADGIDRFYVWFADFAPVDTLHRFAEVIRVVADR